MNKKYPICPVCMKEPTPRREDTYSIFYKCPCGYCCFSIQKNPVKRMMGKVPFWA